MSDATCMQFYGQTSAPMQGLGEYSKWDEEDIIERLQPLLARGWSINAQTKRIAPSVVAFPWQTPWWHHRGADGKQCTLWHKIMFDCWGFIPSGCQECWKTVVRPRTLRELFQLQELERKVDLPSKCGIEIRSYTPAHYGGYFYANSLDEGRDYYKTVRAAVDEMISPDIPVILKRACTEMELKPGIPSITWTVTDDQLRLERYIEERVDTKPIFEMEAPDYALNRLYKRWVHWAFSHNDQTYLDYTGGNVLHTPPVMYHEGDLDEIKRDIAVARTIGVGMDPQKAVDLHEEITGIMSNRGVNQKVMGAALGYSRDNPLFADSLVELQGEEDQTT